MSRAVVAISGGGAAPIERGRCAGAGRARGRWGLPAAVMVLAALLARAGLAQSDADEGTPAPVAVVERLHGALLDAMQRAGELGFEGRREMLAPVIEETFDLDSIVRIALGRHWRELSPEQQARMREVFTRLTVATYAARFDGYDGQEFQTRSTREVDERTVLVRTAIVSAPGDETSLDYLVRRDQGDWQIVNVIADGVSDLSLKRADYTAVLRDEDFEALIAKLEQQIADYAQDAQG